MTALDTEKEDDEAEVLRTPSPDTTGASERISAGSRTPEDGNSRGESDPNCIDYVASTPDQKSVRRLNETESPASRRFDG
jgi:hypothetical protein